MRILVTGSVCAGKTTTARYLQELLPDFKLFNLSDVVISEGLFTEVDQKFDSRVPDENKLMQWIREHVNVCENVIIDHHSFDIFGATYFDLVVIVTCCDKGDNHYTLRKRLEGRGYSDVKIQENMEVELLQQIAADCERFRAPKIVINNADSLERLRQQVEAIAKRVRANEFPKLRADDQSSTEDGEELPEEDFEEYEEFGEEPDDGDKK